MRFLLKSMLIKLSNPVNVNGVTLSIVFSLKMRTFRLESRLKAPSMLLKLFFAKLRYFKAGRDKSVAILLIMLNPKSKYSKFDSAPAANVSWSIIAIWLPYMFKILRLVKYLNVPFGISLMML